MNLYNLDLYMYDLQKILIIYFKSTDDTTIFFSNDVFVTSIFKFGISFLLLLIGYLKTNIKINKINKF